MARYSASKGGSLQPGCPAMTSPILAGLRVLVVEDEFMIAMLIEQTLADNDCVVVGSCSNVSDALQLAQSGSFDLAVLDVNLRGEKVYPVAEMLERRGIPFVLLSGYGKEAVPPGHPDWRACSKPFTSSTLVEILTLQIGGRRHEVEPLLL